MIQRVWPMVLVAVVAAAGGVLPGRFVPAADDEPPPQVDFRRDVWPILKAKCVRCHNPKQKKGELDMSTRAAMLKGGNSGPAFVPGDSEKSLMLDLIHFDEMPPADEKPRVTQAELKTLRAWVDAGAPGGKKSDTIDWGNEGKQ